MIGTTVNKGFAALSFWHAAQRRILPPLRRQRSRRPNRGRRLFRLTDSVIRLLQRSRGCYWTRWKRWSRRPRSRHSPVTGDAREDIPIGGLRRQPAWGDIRKAQWLCRLRSTLSKRPRRVPHNRHDTLRLRSGADLRRRAMVARPGSSASRGTRPEESRHARETQHPTARRQSANEIMAEEEGFEPPRAFDS